MGPGGLRLPGTPAGTRDCYHVVGGGSIRRTLVLSQLECTLPNRAEQRAHVYAHVHVAGNVSALNASRPGWIGSSSAKNAPLTSVSAVLARGKRS